MYYKLLAAIKYTIELYVTEVKSVFIMQSGLINVENFITQPEPMIAVSIERIVGNSRHISGMLESTCALNISIVLPNKKKAPIGNTDIDALKLLEKISLLVMNGYWQEDPLLNNKNDDALLFLPTDLSTVFANTWKTYTDEAGSSVIWNIIWEQTLLLGKDRFEYKAPNVSPFKDIKIKFDINQDGIFDEEKLINNSSTKNKD